MKKLALVCILAAMALSGSAIAQNYDNIGVYVLKAGVDGAPDYFDFCLSDVPLGTVVHCYLNLTQLTSPGVGGFECKLVFGGPLLFVGTSVVFPVDAIDVATKAGEFIVGFAEPVLASGGVVTAMEFNVVVMDPATPGEIFVENTYFHSLPEALPAYLDIDEASSIKPLHQSTGDETSPVFFVNGGCVPVGVEQTTFDGVKSLYR